MTSQHVKDWRQRTKERIVKSMGGGCCICGYNKYNGSLALHHLDPDKKDFTFGSIRASPKKWDTIVEELRKCVMLCHNCHNEVHAEISIIPSDAPKFNEIYSDYSLLEKEDKDDRSTICPECGEPKSKYNKTCSLICARRKYSKVDWSQINLEEFVKSGRSVLSLAKELGVK